MVTALLSTRISDFFDYSSAAISLLLVLVLAFRKIYRTRQGRIFFLMVVVNFTEATFEILTNTYIPARPQDVWLKYVFHIFVLLSYIVIETLFFFYVYNFTRNKEENGYSKGVFVILWMVTIDIFLVVTTPFTHLIIQIYPGEVVTLGYLFYSLYAIGILLFSLEIYMMNTSIYHVSHLKSGAIWGALGITFIATVVQMIVPEVLINAFSNSLALILIYASVENPSFYYYQEERCYNTNAFLQMTDKLKKGKEKWILFVGIEEADYVKRLISDEEHTKMCRTFLDKLHKGYPNNMVFYLENSSFAIILDKSPEILSDKIVGMYFNSSNTGYQNVGLTPYACIISTELIHTTKDLLHAKSLFDERKRKVNSLVRTTFITESDMDEKRRDDEIVRALMDAIDKKRVKVFYQPIFSVKTGRFDTAEAMVRITDSKIGTIRPSEFIPIAEEAGLIIGLGESVFEQICLFINKHDISKMGLAYIEVNLSVLQCLQYDFSDRLISIMAKYEIDPRLISLELNSTSYKLDMEMVEKNVTRLREYGVRFALDDFGSGFSNAEFIANIPVDRVNLSADIVAASLEDRYSSLLIRNYINIIKDFEYDCTAKGIESKEMSDAMKELGCDSLQGYFYSNLLSEGEFVDFITNKQH